MNRGMRFACWCGLFFSSLAVADAPFVALTPVPAAGGATTGDTVIADFNNDGFPDLASVDRLNFLIFTQLSDGAGSFTQTTPYGPLNLMPSALAAGDLDGDGQIDLVVGTATNTGGDEIAVLLGNGDGTFVLSDTYPTGDFVTAVVLFDANGDGKLDLAVATSNTYWVSVFRGEGDGHFTDRVDYPLGGVASDLAVADINEDDHPDLIVSTFGNSASFATLTGIGDGSFNDPVTHDTNNAITWELVVADFNRDGHMDVAVSDTSGRVQLFAGQGDATFSPATSIETPTDGAISIAAGDIDADGIVDLVVGITAQLTYYAGRGDGSFTNKGSFQGPFVGFDGPNSPQHMTLADLDGDGRLDLIAPDFGSWYLYLFTGDTIIASSFE
jgi:hypothetical protein